MVIQWYLMEILEILKDPKVELVVFYGDFWKWGTPIHHPFYMGFPCFSISAAWCFIWRCPFFFVGKTMPFLPPMTGNGKFIAPIKMVMSGGWFIVVLPTLPLHHPFYVWIFHSKPSSYWGTPIFGNLLIWLFYGFCMGFIWYEFHVFSNGFY